MPSINGKIRECLNRRLEAARRIDSIVKEFGAAYTDYNAALADAVRELASVGNSSLQRKFLIEAKSGDHPKRLGTLMFQVGLGDVARWCGTSASQRVPIERVPLAELVTKCNAAALSVVDGGLANHRGGNEP